MSMNKNLVYSIIAIVVIAIAGFFGYQYYQGQSTTDTTATQESTAATTPTPTIATSAPQEVSYPGEEGKTALALLQDKAEVEMTGEGEMAFVTTINGYKAKDNEFWAFYLNGESSQVGAGTYVTKAQDQITWKIETF